MGTDPGFRRGDSPLGYGVSDTEAPSFRRTPESMPGWEWTPAFAGVTLREGQVRTASISTRIVRQIPCRNRRMLSPLRAM